MNEELAIKLGEELAIYLAKRHQRMEKTIFNVKYINDIETHQFFDLLWEKQF